MQRHFVYFSTESIAIPVAEGCGADPNLSYKLITSIAETEMSSVKALRGMGIDVEVIPSRYTVNFENIYGHNQNERKQRVRAKADPFTIDKLEHLEARYIVLGTLLPDDFSLDVIKYLHTKGTLVVDAQGFLRDVRGEEVYAIDWTEKMEAMKYIDVLKVNEYEAEVLTGESDLHRAAQILGEWGVKEVLLSLGSFGSIIYADGPDLRHSRLSATAAGGCHRDAATPTRWAMCICALKALRWKTPDALPPP